MKTPKQTPNTRRSLRNIANDSKISKGKSTKVTATKGKSTSGEKLRVSKAPIKNNPQASKQKKKAEEERPNTPPQSVDSGTEKPYSDAVKPKPDKSSKPKAKRTKKKQESNQETHDNEWRTLDDFGEKVLSSDDDKRKSNCSQKGDRRKQSLIERNIPCTVLVQTRPVAVPLQRGGNDSDCEVVDGVTELGNQGSDLLRNVHPIEVDVDEAHSETESNFCEIIDEPSTGFDYRRLYVQANRVALPSSLWACHLDPRKEFVSFTRFNPDFPSSSSNIVDRVVMFKGSTKPNVFCNGEPVVVPEEICSVETLTDISQVLQHLNSVALP